MTILLQHQTVGVDIVTVHAVSPLGYACSSGGWVVPVNDGFSGCFKCDFLECLPSHSCNTVRIVIAVKELSLQITSEILTIFRLTTKLAEPPDKYSQFTTSSY